MDFQDYCNPSFKNILFLDSTNKKDQIAELKNMQLFRVMRLSDLFEWGRTGMNALVLVEKWDDPWERALFKQRIPCDDGSLNLSSFRYYGQCWTKNRNESEYMWRIYNKEARDEENAYNLWKSLPKRENNLSVRVEVNAYDLREALIKYVEDTTKFSQFSCFCGNIKYYNEVKLKEILETESIEGRCYLKNFEETLFVKRDQFSYENEFRILYSPISCLAKNKSRNQDLFKFNMDISNIKSILLQPIFNSNLSEREHVNSYFNSIKNRLRNMQFDCKIDRSVIYDYPELKIKYSAS